MFIKTRSVRYIFLVIVLLAIIMTIYNFYYVYPSFTKLLVENTEDDALRLGTHLSSMFFHEKRPLSRDEASHAFEKYIRDHFDHFGLIKLKIFSPSGEIIHSTDEGDIGEINENEYFHTIVSTGNPYTKVVNKNTKSLEGQTVKVDVVETYVPVMHDGKFIGAFELYYDITERNLNLNRVMNKSLLVPLIMLFFGIVVTAIMIKHLDRSIVRQKKIEDELNIYTEKLHQSNRELESFAHIASHDLQEPLRKVTAFGGRLKSKYADVLGDQGRDYLERMESAANRMQHLINGLLMFSRVTTKAQPFVQVDLSTVIKEVLSDLEVRLYESHGKVEVEELPTVSADPLQMRQLFQNLIGNALKFTKKDEPPVVRISAASVRNGNGYDHNGYYQFTLKDNGIGFDEQYTDRIFGVFQRLHGRSEYEGSGIGLSVCKKIVERHGGTIAAKSAPGEGATFIFTMPAARAKSKEPDPSGPEVQAS